MHLGVTDASERLGLTPRRVRALIGAGALPAQKVGSVYVLDERDVDAFAERDRPHHTRSMSPRIAWSAAALLDGVTPTWVRADELSRLRARLARSTTHTGTWRAQMARAAARRERFRAGPEQTAELLAHPLTVRTGRSATNLATDALVGTVGASVWVTDRELAEQLRRDLGLLRSSTGNVTIAIPAAPNLPTLGADGVNAFRLVVATDLLAEDEPRADAAGAALLETVTDELARQRS